MTRARILVDGVARRGGIAADGGFSRTVTAGDHKLTVIALGHGTVTRAVTAGANAALDLGEIPLAPAQPPGMGR